MAQPNDTNPSNSAELDAELAARLERLSARRAPAAARQPARRADAAYASPSTRPIKRKRRHAAAGARQAALALSLATTGGLTYAMSLAPSATASGSVQTGGVVISPTPSGSASSALSSSGSAAAAANSSASSTGSESATAAPTASTAAATSDPIVVNGDAFSNRWGVVQVQATFEADGTITSVTTLQTPDGDNQSVRINDRAVPTLNSEALTVQSANVDTVSGATYTSNDYRRSLQSAIDTAQASGLIAA